MKANTVTKLAVGIALSMAVAFGTTAAVHAQDAAPAAKPAAKKAKAPDPCRGFDQAACTAAKDKRCRWLPARTANGKELKARCRQRAPNPCLGVEEAACAALANKRCAWITNAVNKKGKQRRPFCQRQRIKKN